MKRVYVTYTVEKDFMVSDATSYEDILVIAEEAAPIGYSEMDIDVENGDE